MGDTTEASMARRGWRSVRNAAAALALGVAACGSDRFDATVTLDRVQYAPGDTGLVRLVNDGSTDLFYNLCPRVLERMAGGEWVAAPEFPVDIACPDALYVLAPGQHVTEAVVFPDPLADGTYRWLFTWLSRDEIVGGAFSLATAGVTVAQ